MNFHMKKLFLCALFATVFGGVASAHPITVTLSKGQTVILESTNYHSTAEFQHISLSIEENLS